MANEEKDTNVRRDYKARLFEMILLNINPGYNNDIVNACKTLNDYIIYTSRVRGYAEQMQIEEAVEKAIKECIAEDVLADFLVRYRAEVKKMSIYEYDEERQRIWDREEGKEIGKEEGEKLKYASAKIMYDLSVPKDEAVMKLMDAFDLSKEEVQSTIEKYWK